MAPRKTGDTVPGERSEGARTQEERTETAKARIRTAALELFALQGFEATSLADISLRAGYSRALAQYHYGDKSKLALELLDSRLRRDMNADLLKCPPSTPPAEAWALLEEHLRSTSAHYRRLHGRGQDLLVRGEMVVHQAANMSTDLEMTARLNAVTSTLLSQVAHVLEICRQGGFIRQDADVQGAAVFYVHSIWGLALALFVNPKGEAQIGRALAFLGASMNALRRDAG